MKYKAMPDVVMTQICGKYYLVTSEETIQLNEIAAFYWKQLEKGASEEELRAITQEYYEIGDPEMLRDDVSGFVDFLRCKHCIVRYRS